MPATKKYPLLYKLDAKDAVQHWKIEVHDSAFVPGVAVIKTVWGPALGKQQETAETIEEGKNVGRSNETTPRQQAEAEAQSRWEKKLKKGYVKTLEEAKAGKVDSIITGGINPMLAKRFDEDGHKLTYPCYVQPKLDGHRCIAMIDANGKCTLWSRTRKPITSMTHIEAAVERLGMHSTILDGELYNHNYKDRFEELTSFIRNSEFQPGAEHVQYHVYDVPSAWGFGKRWEFLRDHIKLSLVEPPEVARYNMENGLPPAIVPVETIKVDCEEDLMLEFERFLAHGYEGAMARNAEGGYEYKRSHNLLKIKEFQDSEFKVIGVEEGRGKLAGHAIFVCVTDKGVEFRAKLVGDTDNLKQYFKNPKLAVGRYLTVKYQGFTNKNGVPRFPVALRFREDV